MRYPRPKQPKAARVASDDNSNVIGKVAKHYLTDLEHPSLPYSRNHYLLVELMTTGGDIPQPNCDIVIFHFEGTVLSVAQVTGIIAIESSADHPGQYRTLVSCEPMSTLADVPVAEEFEDYVDAEVDHVLFRVGENKCPRTSKGWMPKAAPMRNQAMAQDFTLDIIAQALWNIPVDSDSRLLSRC